MSKLIITILFLISSPAIFAQQQFINKAKGSDRHHFLLTGSYIGFINNPDIETLQGTKQFLKANNTTGYNIGIGYDYTNKYNISFGAFSTYGIQKHDLVWQFGFKDFDSRADFGDYKSLYSYNRTIPYLNMSLFIGYEYQPSKKSNLKIQAKTGIGLVHYFKWDHQRLQEILSYTIDDRPDTVFTTQYAFTDASSGGQSKWYNQKNDFYTLHIGLIYPVKSNFIREYRVGISYTHVFAAFSPGDNFFNISSASYYHLDADNKTLIRDGYQNYKNKFRTVGITACIGF